MDLHAPAKEAARFQLMTIAIAPYKCVLAYKHHISIKEQKRSAMAPHF
jgi:hypothetical protein